MMCRFAVAIPSHALARIRANKAFPCYEVNELAVEKLRRFFATVITPKYWPGTFASADQRCLRGRKGDVSAKISIGSVRDGARRNARGWKFPGPCGRR